MVGRRIGARHRGRRRATLGGVEEHRFRVAGAVVVEDDRLLLVRNRRRNGSHDWSTPGGVIDPEDPSVLHGLAREVEEETGLRVTEWGGLLYEVTATSLDLGWVMHCEVHLVRGIEGALTVDDPDGIVDHAAYVGPDQLDEHLAGCFPWVREPLAEWLLEQWSDDEPRRFRYEVRGRSLDALTAVRVD